MKIAILIPARFQSTRFEGKPLAKIYNKTMIQMVYEGVKNSKYASFIAVLTDNESIFKEAKRFGSEAFIVKGSFESGTDRIAYFAKDKNFDYIVNMQGDEPLIDSDTIDRLIECALNTNEEMATLAAACEKELIDDPNTVKLVKDANDYALYFSRSKIPFDRYNFENYLKHIGIYIYSKNTLVKLYGLKKSSLENAEGLEQLRALENGIKIKICLTDKVLIGVDTKNDLKKVEKYLKEQHL